MDSLTKALNILDDLDRHQVYPHRYLSYQIKMLDDDEAVKQILNRLATRASYQNQPSLVLAAFEAAPSHIQLEFERTNGSIRKITAGEMLIEMRGLKHIKA
ncbi:hypothetical protein CZP2022_135 [Vibrio phage C-ZP2022]|nr:hypothetical protein CZP2022_135 [Vibrio phage C-ZP2022]